MGAEDCVGRLGDGLDLYARPYDPQRPVVCFDEPPGQLIAGVRGPLPAAPGRPRRIGYEYRRQQGTANLLLSFEPLAGRRHIAVTAQRTAQDFARPMKALVDVHHPAAAVVAVVAVVLDNLSTHSPAALHQTFPPAEARRLLPPAEARRLPERLEFHCTPKHGRWLNRAELEFSALGRQCLDRRIAGQESLRRAVAAWPAERNAARATAPWRFTITGARTKLHRLYPA